MKKLLAFILFIFILIFFLSAQNVSAVEDPIGSWVDEPNLPYILAHHEAVIYNSRLFLIAGSAFVYYSGILSSTINPDGSLSNWSVVSHLPQALTFSSAVINGNRIYNLGGAGPDSVDSVYTATVNSDGTLSAWSALKPLPKRLADGRAVIFQNKIYVIGGATWTDGSGPVIQPDIFVTNINADGTIGPWQNLTPLPEGRYGFSLFISNNRLIVIGGATPGSAATNSIITSVINSDGTLGNWEQLTPLPEPSRRPGHILFNGFFLLLGGYNGSQFLNSIYYAPVNPDGTAGTWTKSSDILPTINCCFPLISHNQFLYMTGGHDGSTYFSTVRKALMGVSPTPTPTPSPTPTPTPTPNLLIFLPGLGGSWNHEEIFLGNDQPQSAWYKTPFRVDYDGLIQTLQNAGYTLNQNLFVFYYDWLQSINQSADDLENFIDTVVNPSPGTKVNLVGHSLGGLVGRTYIQNNPGSHKVDQLVTAGSPHKGAPQVYRVWEGADLTGLLGEKERIGAGIILRLRGFGYPNLVSAIRNLIPSLGNLLFIEDYLKWGESGMVKPEADMSQQNTWLKSLGVSPGITNTIVGTSIDTPRWLRIVERSQIDEKLGRWEDGKPVGEEFASGDRTVLEESARIMGANIVTLAGLDHGDLVKKEAGLAKILELLGISDVEIAEQPEIPFEPALVFSVASPVTLRVTDPLGRKIGAGIEPPEIPSATFSIQEKIIIIPEAIDGEYKAEVIGENGGGSYQLLVGQLTQEQDIWSIYQDVVGSGETDTYTIPIDNTLATTDSYLANLINSKLKNLLRQIRQQELGPRVKAMLSAKTLRILGQTKPLSVLLKLEKDKLATKFVQRATIRTTEAIDYAEEFNPDSLPALREILDLLGQLGQLLEI